MNTSDVFIKNQPILTKLFNNIIQTNKNSQAYIIFGESKKKIQDYAILLSKILICPKKYTLNCNECNICSRIDNNNYSELKIIYPENKIIKKEEIINLKNYFNTESIEGRNQVYIIHDVEMLNQAAANSILKFLEEPDSNLIAIFTTTNIDSVIKTIISRCQIIKINNIRTKYGIDFVKEVSNLEEDQIFLTIDFLKELEKNYCLAFSELKNKFIKVFNTKELISSALKVMLLYYKDILNYKLKNECYYFETNDIKLVEKYQTENLVSKKITFILENLKKVEYNVNILLFMDNLLIGIGEIINDKSNRS